MPNKKIKTSSGFRLDENKLAKNFIDLAGAIFILIDKKGIVRKINKKGVDILGGKDEKNIIGRNWINNFVPQKNRKEVFSVFNEIKEGKRQNLEYFENPIKTIKGEIKTIAWNNSIYKNEKGRIEYVISFGQDITEKKKIEDQIKKAKKDLEKKIIQRTRQIIKETGKKTEALEALSESKRHYEQIMDTIEDGICAIGKNHKIISFNKAFAKSLKMAGKKNIKGKDYCRIINFYKHGALKNFYCLGCDKKTCVLDSVFKSKKPLTIEKESRDKNGRKYFHRLTFLPSIKGRGNIDQLVISIRDITKRKTAEEAVRRLSRFNQRIFDNAPVSILILDAKGFIISANKTASKLMKKGVPDIVGRKLAKTPTMKDNKKLVAKYKLLLKEGRPLYRENLQYQAEADMSVKYLNILAVPLYGGGGEIEGAISMAVDNTEVMNAKNKLDELNRQLEQKVEARTEELNKTNKKLNILLDLKSKFVADASHELRTPLTVIQGNLDLAIREAEFEHKPIPEMHEIIMSEVVRMRNILTDLTMLTNVDSKSEILSYEPIQAKNLIKAAVQSMGILAKQKGVSLISQKKIGNITLKGDEAKLEKLLLNIIRNAIKYTDRGGRIKISAKKEGNWVFLGVEDTGAGIPENEIDFIFERFYRVDRSRNSGEGGTGLGLSIAKWIAEAHGGKIKVKSKLGAGSNFTIILPSEYHKNEKFPVEI